MKTITFKFTEQEKTPYVFGQVKEDQFFLDIHGQLCQKVLSTEYNVVADAEGIPEAYNIIGVSEGLEILEILPHVEKITWE